jgi:hypothetical protein
MRKPGSSCGLRNTGWLLNRQIWKLIYNFACARNAADGFAMIASALRFVKNVHRGRERGITVMRTLNANNLSGVFMKDKMKMSSISSTLTKQ